MLAAIGGVLAVQLIALALDFLPSSSPFCLDLPLVLAAVLSSSTGSSAVHILLVHATLVLLLLLLWSLQPLIGFGPIWMSGGPSRSSNDDVVDLALDFQGLHISVRGSSSAAVDFVRRVSSFAGPQSEPAVEEPHSPWSIVRECQAIEETFPDLPEHIRRLASSLPLRSCRLPPEDRLDRAWKAGCWAKAVLDGRARVPQKTPKIDLANKVYAVIRGPGILRPRLYKSLSSFSAAVGELQGSATICHGFPSRTEAAVYVEATGEILEESSD